MDSPESRVAFVQLEKNQKRNPLRTLAVNASEKEEKEKRRREEHNKTRARDERPESRFEWKERLGLSLTSLLSSPSLSPQIPVRPDPSGVITSRRERREREKREGRNEEEDERRSHSQHIYSSRVLSILLSVPQTVLSSYTRCTHEHRSLVPHNVLFWTLHYLVIKWATRSSLSVSVCDARRSSSCLSFLGTRKR